LLGAHYDSRGSFGSVSAPGANDDGSGIITLLAIARTIARKGVKFHANVELVAFAGEEQGLLGSRAYSRQYITFHFVFQTKCVIGELRAADTNLTVMIQADMLAYHAPDEPSQLGLPEQFVL
jgi:Zn-dependent M28 family amino/carboxypeptidase